MIAPVLRRCHGLLRTTRTGSGRVLRGPAVFVRSRRGGVAIESALGITVLVMVFGGLTTVALGVFNDDSANRAARAAARAVALDSGTAATKAEQAAIACDAVRRELGLKADFDCTKEWETFDVSIREKPSQLKLSAKTAGAPKPCDANGDSMVLVEIVRTRSLWVQAMKVFGSSKAGATGVARCEPRLRSRTTGA